jgi:hypothetical protein
MKFIHFRKFNSFNKIICVSFIHMHRSNCKREGLRRPFVNAVVNSKWRFWCSVLQNSRASIVNMSKSHTNYTFPMVLEWTWTLSLQHKFWISRQHVKIPHQLYFPNGFGMNLDFVSPTQILNLTVLFCAWPQRFISCHFSALYRRDPISLYMLVNAHNKCDSKYTMRSATRMQVVEF